MEMKDRVDNFLKVARERMSNNIANSESRYHLNDLCGSLMDLAKEDKKLVDYLDVEYNKILNEVK